MNPPLGDRGVTTHKDALMRLPHVVGVGIQEETDADGKTHEFIIVYVSEKVPTRKLNNEEVVPTQLDSIEVRVREIGSLSLVEPR